MITTLGSYTVVVWPFIPQGDHSETIAFNTDVIKPFASEQRISLRTKPRQTLNYPYIVDPDDYSQMKSFIRYAGASYFAVPVWHESTRVGQVSSGASEILFDTDYADYRDGEYAIVWQDNNTFETVTITTVASDRLTLTGTTTSSYTNAIVAPLRICRMPNLSVDTARDKGRYSDVTASFFVVDTVDLSSQATAYTAHSGYQVMEDRPVRYQSLNETVIWPQEVLDNDTGVLDTDTSRSQAFESYTASWNTGICGTPRHSLWAIRTWLHSMRGRALSFWMPSYNADLTLSADIGASDTSITVNGTLINTYYGGTVDIMILLYDGTRYYRSVTASTPGASTESLSITALGTAVSAADVEMISIMQLSRLDSDRIEISHNNGGATINIPVMEVPA